MKVLINAYGWCEALEISGNYALLRMPSGTKFFWNMVGYEISK